MGQTIPLKRKFGIDILETLNGDHSMLIVGSHIDARSERIIGYLSDTHSAAGSCHTSRQTTMRFPHNGVF